MYCIMVSTGATLHEKGQTSIDTAAQAAEALRPIAGDAAGALFALGIIDVGFLAVPVMTTGAAYDFAQAVGWKATLNANHEKPRNSTSLSVHAPPVVNGRQKVRLFGAETDFEVSPILNRLS